MSKHNATLLGFVAVILWSFLALFTVGTAPMPALLLNAICFAIGGGLGLIWTARSGGFSKLRSVPLWVYGFGTVGLFGYHALYFSALRLAPAAEAGLIAYLWPLLIVLFSGFLPSENLKRAHILGAIVAFGGAALIVLGGGEGFNTDASAGYALAFCCALFWSGYSVISRRLDDVPTAAVSIFCIATSVLSFGLHLALETAAWPRGTLGWVSVLALGLGPVGLAFYVWDVGVKKGDIQLLGTSSYAAPLLSTLILVAAGVAQAGWTLVLAAILITAGALIAARASVSNNDQSK